MAEFIEIIGIDASIQKQISYTIAKYRKILFNEILNQSKRFISK